MKVRQYMLRRIALTNEHGSWVFLFSPLLIGLFAGGRWSSASIYLTLAALAGFLIRHPAIIAVKAYSGRRSKEDLPAAYFWIGVYGALGLLMVAGLIMRGFGYLLYLAIPGIPVFLWHLYLVRKRAERRKIGIEIVASGVLALCAPAGYWIGTGSPDSLGWWLWGLTWFQSAASIVYAYLRLEQRVLKQIPAMITRLRMSRRSLLYTTFNLAAVTLLSLSGQFPTWLPLAFAIQWLETLWGGLLRPAVGFKATTIGFRQLAVSTLFTIVFIVIWQFS